eukprot:jgi/Bigna1/74936/fgenesh1_pg.31_\
MQSGEEKASQQTAAKEFPNVGPSAPGVSDNGFDESIRDLHTRRLEWVRNAEQLLHSAEHLPDYSQNSRRSDPFNRTMPPTSNTSSKHSSAPENSQSTPQLPVSVITPDSSPELLVADIHWGGRKQTRSTLNSKRQTSSSSSSPSPLPEDDFEPPELQLSKPAQSVDNNEVEILKFNAAARSFSLSRPSDHQNKRATEDDETKKEKEASTATESPSSSSLLSAPHPTTTQAQQPSSSTISSSSNNNNSIPATLDETTTELVVEQKEQNLEISVEQPQQQQPETVITGSSIIDRQENEKENSHHPRADIRISEHDQTTPPSSSLSSSSPPSSVMTLPQRPTRFVRPRSRKMNRLRMSRSLNRLNIRLKAIKTIQKWLRGRMKIRRIMKWRIASMALVRRHHRNCISSCSSNSSGISIKNHQEIKPAYGMGDNYRDRRFGGGVEKARAYAKAYIIRSIYRSTECTTLRNQIKDIRTMINEIREEDGNSTHKASFEKQLRSQMERARIQALDLFERRRSLVTLLKKKRPIQRRIAAPSVQRPLDLKKVKEAWAQQRGGGGDDHDHDDEKEKKEREAVTSSSGAQSSSYHPQNNTKKMVWTEAADNSIKRQHLKTDVTVRFEPGSVGLVLKTSSACVSAIHRGKQADSKGIKPGWLVTEVNGRKVSSPDRIRLHVIQKDRIRSVLPRSAKPRTVTRLETRYKPKIKNKSKAKKKNRVSVNKSKLDFSKIKSKIDSRWANSSPSSAKDNSNNNEDDTYEKLELKATIKRGGGGRRKGGKTKQNKEAGVGAGGAPQEIRGNKDKFFINVSDYRKAMMRTSRFATPPSSSYTHSSSIPSGGDEVRKPRYWSSLPRKGGAAGDDAAANTEEKLTPSLQKLHNMDAILMDVEQTIELLIGREGKLHIFDPPSSDNNATTTTTTRRETRIPHVSNPKGLFTLVRNPVFQSRLQVLMAQQR